MNEVCRLCRKSVDDHFVSLFEQENSQNVHEMVTKLFPELTIELNDRLPQNICDDCFKITTSAFALKQTSLQCEKIFISELRSLSEKQGHEVLLSVDMNFADTGEAIDITTVPTAIEATLKQSANPNLNDGDFKTNYTIIESAELTWLSCNFCGTEASTADDMAEHIETSHNPMMNIFEMKESSGDLSSDDNLILNADVMFSSRPQIQGVKSCENPIELGGLLEGIDCYITDDPFDSSGGCIKESDFSCARCPSRFRNKRCLQDHIRRHHTDNLKCQQCATSFEDKNKLRQHNLVEHKKDCRELPPDKVICDKKCCACLKEFETDAELLSHLKNHRGLTGRLLCDHKAVVKCFDDLVAHAKYHLQPKTHECIYCNKPFPFDSKFFIHLSGHKRTDVHRKISCPKCGSKFRNARELETHDKVKHRNESLFICPFCTKSFCSKSSCESHIKFVHKNEKRFECKVCKMKFNLKSHLSRHEATHQKKRPCVCQLCGNSFKTKEGLDFHMKRHDGSMKKFGCTQCSYTFVSKNRLQVHMLTHSRTKPFECEYCDRAYTSKGDLVKHLQKVHVGSAVYRCEKCPEAFPRIVELREHLLVHYES